MRTRLGLISYLPQSPDQVPPIKDDVLRVIERVPINKEGQPTGHPSSSIFIPAAYGSLTSTFMLF